MSRMTFTPPTQVMSVAGRLEKRLGLGTNPELRKALYVKLQQLCEGSEGTKVLECIDTCVSDAHGKSDPGKYFAYVVCRRLQERGLMEARSYVDW